MTNGRPLTPAEIESRPIEIEKTAELAGHEPNDDNVGRCRRLLTGETTPKEAQAEINAKYREDPATDD